MRCGVILLCILAGIGGIATLIPGGGRIFRSWVFVIPELLLGLNLFLCSVRRFPELVRRMRAGARPGILGSWLCHLGMLILLTGLFLGQFLNRSAYVYGVPGQEKEVAGTSLSVTIEAFEAVYREDGSAEQYRSWITVTDPVTGETRSGELAVNHPFSAFGLDFLQSGTGWAVTADFVGRDGNRASGILCEGEVIEMADAPLQLILQPDEGAVGTEKTEVNARFYYDGELWGEQRVKIGETVEVNGFRFSFRDPRRYTMIQVVSEPAEPVVLLGGILLLLGAVITVVFRSREGRKQEEEK